MIGRYGCQSPEFARLGIRKNPKEFSEESVHHFHGVHSVHSVHHFHDSSTTSSKFHQDSITTSVSALPTDPLPITWKPQDIHLNKKTFLPTPQKNPP